MNNWRFAGYLTLGLGLLVVIPTLLMLSVTGHSSFDLDGSFKFFVMMIPIGLFFIIFGPGVSSGDGVQ